MLYSELIVHVSFIHVTVVKFLFYFSAFESIGLVQIFCQGLDVDQTFGQARFWGGNITNTVYSTTRPEENTVKD